MSEHWATRAARRILSFFPLAEYLARAGWTLGALAAMIEECAAAAENPEADVAPPRTSGDPGGWRVYCADMMWAGDVIRSGVPLGHSQAEQPTLPTVADLLRRVERLEAAIPASEPPDTPPRPSVTDRMQAALDALEADGLSPGRYLLDRADMWQLWGPTYPPPFPSGFRHVPVEREPGPWGSRLLSTDGRIFYWLDGQGKPRVRVGGGQA